MKTTEDFKDVLVPKGRDPAISARDGTTAQIPVSRTGRRDGTEPMIRHGTEVHIRDDTDIHIREGTGLGSRNKGQPTTGTTTGMGVVCAVGSERVVSS